MSQTHPAERIRVWLEFEAIAPEHASDLAEQAVGVAQMKWGAEGAWGFEPPQEHRTRRQDFQAVWREFRLSLGMLAADLRRSLRERLGRG